MSRDRKIQMRTYCNNVVEQHQRKWGITLRVKDAPQFNTHVTTRRLYKNKQAAHRQYIERCRVMTARDGFGGGFTLHPNLGSYSQK